MDKSVRRLAIVCRHCSSKSSQIFQPIPCATTCRIDSILSLPFVAGNIVYTGASGEGQESVLVLVRDGRMARDRFTLDEAGFELLSLEKAISASFTNAFDVQAKVYPEAERYIKQSTGAHKVLVFDHILRDGARLQGEFEAGISRGDPRATPFLGGPVMQAHNDYTVRSGFTRARQLLELYVDADSLERVLKGRFSIVNFWYPLEPVTCAPLAMCDWSSAKPTDVLTVRYIYEHRFGEVYRVLRNSQHIWVHFPSMTPDEAILLKTFDSSTDVARFALHTAVDLNSRDADIIGVERATCLPERQVYRDKEHSTRRNRRSLELRCLVFYDAVPENFAEGFVPPHMQPDSSDADARFSLKRVELLPASSEW